MRTDGHICRSSRLAKYLVHWSPSLVLLISGGDTRAEAQKADQHASSSVSPVVSVNAVMVGLIDHAGHELWNVEKEGHAPKTAAQWKEIEHHAIQLAASGTLIAMGGTGKADPGWAKSPDWMKFSTDLNNRPVLRRPRLRHRARICQRLSKPTANLWKTCEGCHREFKPDLPTEGITFIRTSSSPTNRHREPEAGLAVKQRHPRM